MGPSDVDWEHEWLEDGEDLCSGDIEVQGLLLADGFAACKCWTTTDGGRSVDTIGPEWRIRFW